MPFSPSGVTGLAFGGYRRTRRLGRGASGEVWEVHDPSSDERLAVKEMDLSNMTSAERALALQEARLLRKISHPHIVRFVDLVIEHSSLYIVMQYVDGGDLRHAIVGARDNRQPFAEFDIWRWFVHISLALQYLHKDRIIHRDVKPGNIFLTGSSGQSQDAVLGDLGIAKVLANTEARAITQIGTPGYLAPEVWKGYRYGYPADVYSLGCTVYELCELRMPFVSGDRALLAAQVCHRRCQPIRDIRYSAELRGVVQLMLEKDPQSRPGPSHILVYAARIFKGWRGSVARQLSSLVERDVIAANAVDAPQSAPTLHRAPSQLRSRSGQPARTPREGPSGRVSPRFSVGHGLAQQASAVQRKPLPPSAAVASGSAAPGKASRSPRARNAAASAASSRSIAAASSHEDQAAEPAAAHHVGKLRAADAPAQPPTPRVKQDPEVAPQAYRQSCETPSRTRSPPVRCVGSPNAFAKPPESSSPAPMSPRGKAAPMSPKVRAAPMSPKGRCSARSPDVASPHRAPSPKAAGPQLPPKALRLTQGRSSSPALVRDPPPPPSKLPPAPLGLRRAEEAVALRPPLERSASSRIAPVPVAASRGMNRGCPAQLPPAPGHVLPTAGCRMAKVANKSESETPPRSYSPCRLAPVVAVSAVTDCSHEETAMPPQKGWGELVPWRDRVEIGGLGGWAAAFEKGCEHNIPAEVSPRDEQPPTSSGAWQHEAGHNEHLDPTELLDFLQSGPQGDEAPQHVDPECMESTMTLLREILQAMPASDDQE